MMSPNNPSPSPRAGAAHRIPGPRGLDALALARQYRRQPLETLLNARQRYGDFFVVETGLYPPAVIVCDHQALRQVLIENAANYRKSAAYQGVGLVMGKGLFTSDGALWRRQRRMIQPGFPAGHASGHIDRVARATAAALDTWSGGDEVDLNARLVRLALTIVGETLFGFDVFSQADSAAAAVTTGLRYIDGYNDAILSLPLWVPTPHNRRFREARDLLFGLVQQIIDERRQDPTGRDDLLSTMMAARDEDGRPAMDDQQLRDEVMTMLIAGHETVAATVTWVFHAVLGAPEVEARLAEEAQRVLGARPATLADLPNLTYTTQVIQEALRLYPPGWMLERSPIAPDTLCGHRIEPRHVISISPYLIHRDPTDWPDPERFDPERFRPEAVAARRKMAWIPFGAGPRRCIGDRLAMSEAQIIVAMLIARYRLRPVAGHVVEPEASVTLRPRDGLRVHLTPRAAPTSP